MESGKEVTRFEWGDEASMGRYKEALEKIKEEWAAARPRLFLPNLDVDVIYGTSETFEKVPYKDMFLNPKEDEHTTD